MAKKIPIVAIIGRANVGKSSFFNAVLSRREAIVAREAGTTRDNVTAKARYDDKDFWLVDTAGMKDPEDDFEASIQEQIIEASDSADIIILMVEAGTAITDEDRRIAKMAHKSQKPVILAINKIDQVKGLIIDDFSRLGIKDSFKISCKQNRGIADLLMFLTATMTKKETNQPRADLTIALVGRPNVGKSSLFNTLAKKQQALVSSRSGTTRDINRASIRYKNKQIDVLDTAGIRRSGKIEVGIERFSVLRSLSAIEQSDVCLLLIDANEIGVQLDQKIAGMVKQAGKGLIIVVSKWDSIDKDPYTLDSMTPKIAHEFTFTPWAPLIFTSSVTGQNVSKLFDIAESITINREKKIPTSDLNKWLRETVNLHPPSGLKNHTPKLNYITQEKDNILPAFKIFGSQTKFIHFSYKRYLETKLREKYHFDGTPLEIWFIEKHVAHKHGESPTREKVAQEGI